MERNDEYDVGGICQHDTPADGTGKQDNFEAAAVYIIPFDPVSKRRGVVKRQHEIAAVKPVLQVQRGSTGVELRFYKPSEYKCSLHIVAS